MSYLVLEENGDCCLLADSEAIGRHPVFFSNLLSGFQLTDVAGARRDPLHVWQSIRDGSWQSLLAGNLRSAMPEDLAAVMRPGVVAIKRVTTRQDGVCTIFWECDGELHVDKCSLAQADHRGLTGQRILPGLACDMYLRQLAAGGNWALWLDFVRGFVAEVFARYSTDDVMLSGIAIDAIARNAVIDEVDGISFFDLEFSEYGDLPRTFYIYRLCLSLMGHRAAYMKGSGFCCLYEFYCYLCANFSLDVGRYFADVRREVEFQAWVTGRPAKAANYFRGLKPFASGLSVRQHIRRMSLRLSMLAGLLRESLT